MCLHSAVIHESWAESGRFNLILFKNTLNYILTAYPNSSDILGAYIKSCSENSLLPKVHGQIAELLGLPHTSNALGSRSHCSRGTCSRCRQIFAWRDVVLLKISSSYCLGPFSALQLKHIKRINYWDLSSGYHVVHLWWEGLGILIQLWWLVQVFFYVND